MSFKKVIGVTAVAAAITLVSLAISNRISQPHADAQSTPTTSTQADLGTARALSSAFASAAERVKPSVVNIVSARKVSRSIAQGPSLQPFRDFFGDDFFERFGIIPEGQPRDFVQRGQGSGVVLEDGYILTNNHVVEDADEVTVRLIDDRTLRAKVVGTDPKTDLAVLQVDDADLQPATLGDSDELRVGDWVVAAGNPFGLSSSMTAGIVSATGRANVGIADYEDFIQTDAAINPGNSGGPLINLDGEVVGINTAIFTRTGGYMGIGFAIPINMAKSIMRSLVDEGRVARGWLGVSIQRMNPGLARSFDYEGESNVLVSEVSPGSPADEAGFESGDIIVGFEGDPVKSMERFRSNVAATAPGTEVKIEVFRGGKKRTLHAKLGELEGTLARAGGTEDATDELGIAVKTLTPELARRLGLDTDLRGVVIVQVEPLSIAADAGLRPNELIVAVNGKPVSDLQDFRNLLDDHSLEEGVRLTVHDGTNQHFVFLEMSKTLG